MLTDHERVVMNSLPERMRGTYRVLRENEHAKTRMVKTLALVDPLLILAVMIATWLGGLTYAALGVGVFVTVNLWVTEAYITRCRKAVKEIMEE